MNNLVSKICDILLKYYTEIISGLWAVIVIIPIDSALYNFFTRQPSYPINGYYWIFLGCYTTFFIASGACLPVIRRKRIIKKIDEFEKIKKISSTQKENLINIIKNISSYQTFLTKDGILNFIMENLFSFAVMFAWFGFEGLISNTMRGEVIIIPIIYLMLFFALITLQSFIDEYIAHQMNLKDKSRTFRRLYNTNNTILAQLISDISNCVGDSEKIGEITIIKSIESLNIIYNKCHNLKK